jgi:hypothetical protein
MKVQGRGPLTLIIITTVAMLAFLVAACSTSDHAANDQKNGRQIVSSIDAKLSQDPDLKTLCLNVASKRGVVTLSGTVNAPVEKLAVEDVARNAAGVKQVIDNLTIASVSAETGTPAAPPDQAAVTPADQAATPPTRRHRHRQIAKLADDQVPAAIEQAQNSAPPAPDNAQAQENSQPAGAEPAPTPGQGSANASAAAPAPQPAPPSTPPPQQVTIPAGTEVRVRMIDGISSGTAQPGEVYKASLSAPLVLDNQVVVPRGADARVRVAHVQSAGHFGGQALLKLELIGFTIDGTKYSIKSDYYTKVGQSRTKNTAEKVGGGAGLGALLGAVIGHGRGAGIGAAIGAAGGAIDQRATQAQDIRVPSEAKIDFTLKSPVTITMNTPQ